MPPVRETVQRSSRPMIFIFFHPFADSLCKTSSGTFFFHRPLYPTIRNDRRVSSVYSSSRTILFVRSIDRYDRIRIEPLVIHRSLSTESISAAKAPLYESWIHGTITRFRVDRFQRPVPIIKRRQSFQSCPARSTGYTCIITPDDGISSSGCLCDAIFRSSGRMTRASTERDRVGSDGGQVT